MLRNIVIGFALVLLTIIAVTQVISVYKTHFAPSPEPEIAATHRWTEGEALAVFQSWATVRDWFTTDRTCWSVITDLGELTPTVIQG